MSYLELGNVEAKSGRKPASHPLANQAPPICTNAFDVVQKTIVATTQEWPGGALLRSSLDFFDADRWLG
ncbi:hypothetical protein K9838_13085 [Xanthomonas phaseoli pv. manihotis]|nr:hypothetical protein K9838_13085 [Xanthomonas phaseoli pv. manihotis]